MNIWPNFEKSNNLKLTTMGIKSNQNVSEKKTYQSPKLKTLGSVKQLTLKIGSVSDGVSLHVG
ncbi:hypothetical protein GCM10028773_06910 [Spirosoma koreense]